MRISLLLEREPFPEILEGTLAQFWSRAIRQPVCVEWHWSLFSRVFAGSDDQIWYINSYLNSIFIPTANSRVFEPIRAEFGHGLVPWRTPLQKAYVHAALTRPASLFLSHASLNVHPAIPDAENTLVIAGNHKIRLVDAAERRSTAVLKQGFGRDFIERELEARLQARRMDLPVPALTQVAEDRTWFCEEYISGTPLNRVANKNQAQLGVRLALKELHRFVREYAYSLPVSEYADSLIGKIIKQLENARLLNAAQSENLLAAGRELHREATMPLSSGAQRITLSAVHGDLQAANILFEDGRIWLVDWEYSDTRQSTYDLLTLLLGSRHPAGLAARLQDFEKDAAAFGQVIPVDWPGLAIDAPAERRRMINLFLMEELLLHLFENANPLFRRPGQGLLQLQAEISRWLKNPCASPGS